MNQAAVKPKFAKLPLARRLTYDGFERLGPIFPKLAAQYAFHLWCKTQRFSATRYEREWLNSTRLIRLKSNDDLLYGYEWGSGETVLLVHGWNGRGSQLGAFALALADAGYCAVAIDLPGHGKTAGSQSDVYAMAKAIEVVVGNYDNVRAVVTHSFGAFPVAWLLREGLAMDRVVSIAAPRNMRCLLDRFCHALHIPTPVQTELRHRVEQTFGIDVWNDASAEHNVAQLNIPGLVIHDTDDIDVPIEHGQALADAWPNCEFHQTSGLGHRKILRDPHVVKKVVEWIGSVGDSTSELIDASE